MSLPLLGILMVLAPSVASMGYVFAYRGKTRFASLTEYMKKGWPLFAPFSCLLYAFAPPANAGGANSTSLGTAILTHRPKSCALRFIQ